jgi:NAD(P)H-dependent FMN reductase
MATQTKNEVRVLGIVGSPRRQGNTETLVDEVLRGAQEAGAQVEKVILNELEIAPCQACETCLETGKCIQQDDMAALLVQMQRSQVWILGTPVYWWGPSAQFKLFLDRWFGQEKIVTFKGRRIILTIPLGGENDVARHVVGMFEDVLDYLEMELFATILAPEVLESGKVRDRPEILLAAYRAGQEAVSPQAN